ncbi:hypothetical protein BKA61DRAFT_55880 [Leptodontidium sp. MPI-SDFR-AT-0119]|nr:hypothetical protein BKA61DRAFT_55880 [Leptodontidium sp. MPI-SDFR-AT-0119]
MQHLFAAPGLAFSWRLSLKRGTSTRTKIARCVRSSRPISSAAQPQVSATSREGHRYEVEVERFDVKCGSSGLISVDLYNSTALKNASNTLIIHLPPTGTHLRDTHPPIPPYLLTPRTALASINYRWNIPSPSASSSKPPKLLSSNPSYAHHPFPTPLHDTLAGYTFLLSTLLPRFSPQPTSPKTITTTKTRQSIYASSSPSPFLPIQRPLLLYGSFLGGTLATSLALTENFTSRSLPTKIVGLITKNAVFNWTDIVTSPSPLASPPSSSSPSQSSSSHQDVNSRDSNWDIQTLHSLKKNLFTTPASAFDSFASPTLFFRTSGLAIPQSWPTADEDQDEALGPRANSTYSTHLSLSPSEIEDLWPSEDGGLSPSPSQNPTTPISTSNPALQNQDQTPATDLGKHISHLTLSPPNPPRPPQIPTQILNFKDPILIIPLHAFPFLFPIHLTTTPQNPTSNQNQDLPQTQTPKTTPTPTPTNLKATRRHPPHPPHPSQENGLLATQERIPARVRG